MKYLITGANGMLGRDLSSHLSSMNLEYIATDHTSLDVTDQKQVFEIIESYKPDVIFHLAAMTNVDGCQSDRETAFNINAISAQYLAIAAERTKAILVYVSSMSVYGGEKDTPYIEFDPAFPQSIYSKSKYAGEQIIQQLSSRYFIVTAGWPFGGGIADKKFVGKFIQMAKNGDALRVVNDKFGAPNYTKDFAKAMLTLIDTELYGKYHLVNSGNYCSRYEFAKTILKYAGLEDLHIEQISSDSMPLPAPRPTMEVGLNFHLGLIGLGHIMRPWQEAIEEYIRTELL